MQSACTLVDLARRLDAVQSASVEHVRPVEHGPPVAKAVQKLEVAHWALVPAEVGVIGIRVVADCRQQNAGGLRWVAMVEDDVLVGRHTTARKGVPPVQLRRGSHRRRQVKRRVGRGGFSCYGVRSHDVSVGYTPDSLRVTLNAGQAARTTFANRIPR